MKKQSENKYNVVISFNTAKEAIAARQLYEVAPEMYFMIKELNSLIERIDLRSKYDPYPIQLKAKQLIKKVKSC